MLDISEIWICHILCSSGHQKGPALSASEQRRTMDMSLRVEDMILLENKDKAYINRAIISRYGT